MYGDIALGQLVSSAGRFSVDGYDLALYVNFEPLNLRLLVDPGALRPENTLLGLQRVDDKAPGANQ